MSLIIRNLTKYYSDKPVINDFSYEFEDNGIYAIVGDSGAGKTTLLRIISGLDRDFQGIISGSIKSFSFSFQEYRLFPQLTALENITAVITGKEASGALIQAKEMLSYLGFKNEEMNLLPNELSGGMKQRVSLARAFLADSDALLLDEPTKELDHTLCEKIYNVIIEQSKSRPVIMVTHRSEDITVLNPTVISLPKLQ